MKILLIVLIVCMGIFISGCDGSDTACLAAVEAEYSSFISLDKYHYIVKDGEGNIFYISKLNQFNSKTSYKTDITIFVKD